MKAITTTTKTVRTISGTVIPEGTTYVRGVSFASFAGEELVMHQDAIKYLSYRHTCADGKLAKQLAAKALKAEIARGVTTVTGTVFLLLISGVHPSVKLTNDQKSALGRILKGTQIIPELVTAKD